MTASRRTFVMMAVGIGPLQAALVRDAGLGRVVFCRASRRTAAWLPMLLGGAVPACEQIERDEVVLCGTEATLVIDGHGYRRFA